MKNEGQTVMIAAALARRSWRVGAAKGGQCRRALGILKGIPPLVIPDLLHMLRAMGHGDSIAIVDSNFPAWSTATHCNVSSSIALAGADLPGAMSAILEIFPVDYFGGEGESPVRYMAPTPETAYPALARDLHTEIETLTATNCPGLSAQPLERFAFYEEAKKCFGIVQCVGERRPYGNVIITKGVIGPDGRDLKP